MILDDQAAIEIYFCIRSNYNCIIRQIYLSLTEIFSANSVLAWARIKKYRKF
ncbi:hypothetical protein FHR29_001629 [Sphingobacterium sp. JUb56]|nr:hypothetical protein [Sphingobacterium sp. JUb56]